MTTNGTPNPAATEPKKFLLDPYREWDFTGPDGDTIDAGQVVAEAMSPGGDTDDLYALLRG